VRRGRRYSLLPGIHLGVAVATIGKPGYYLSVPHLVQFTIHVGM
jgi:hypothetical protein